MLWELSLSQSVCVCACGARALCACVEGGLLKLKMGERGEGGGFSVSPLYIHPDTRAYVCP